MYALRVLIVFAALIHGLGSMMTPFALVPGTAPAVAFVFAFVTSILPMAIGALLYKLIYGRTENAAETKP